MSIASEIQTLSSNKASIKAAILAKSPSTPPGDNMSNWAASIASIPSGGSSPAKMNDVVFRDYDGTILHSYTKQEALALTQLPSLPTRTGLTCQGWNWTLQQMKDYVTSYDKCEIGAMYTTDDGKTRIKITIYDSKYSNIPIVFVQTITNGVEVDWGDGSTVQTYSQTTNGSTQHNINHQYSPSSYPSSYVITFKVNSGTMAFLSNIMGNNSSSQSTTNPRDVWNNMIDNVNIGNNVTSIGIHSFWYCYSLESITIPSSVTSIGNYAFYNCYSLKSITIPSSVTSISRQAFYYCQSLKSITIPSSVTSIENDAFQGCYSLASITIPSSVTSNTGISFSSCYSLASITIPSSVTSIGNSAFNNCYSLASIRIPSSVTSINYNAFYNCYSLESITIPDLVTNIVGYTFYGCYSLASITIPSSVTSIGNSAFNNCCSLASVRIPSSVTSIENQAFAYCYGMKTFDFRRSTLVPTLSNVNAFTGTPTVKEIVVPDELYDDWIAATNWNSTTNQISTSIVKASQSSLGTL